MLALPLSKRKVSMAGDLIRDHAGVKTVELDQALDVLGLWRASHVYPLQSIYMTLRTRSRSVDATTLVSQRLKRVPSIMVKLQRQKGMELARMQDIGGCRAVLKDVKAVSALARKFDCPITDYIKRPKPDGYRSMHLISKYQPAIEKHEAFAGRLIEIQIRSRLQHAWATAVETVDSLLNQKLKAGGGDEKWRRFFALASSLIAIREGCPIVPGTPRNAAEIIKEMRSIDRRIRVNHRLSGLGTSVVRMTESLSAKENRKVGAYILILNLDEKTIQNIQFEKSDIQDSLDEYLKLEKLHYGDPCMQVVHVYVNQIKDLKKAYPNYWLNVVDFMTAMSEVWK